MDIRDFDNTYKYKFVLPIIYVVNWALMLTGPFFYPVAYAGYCFAIALFTTFKGIQSILWNAVAIARGLQFMSRAKKLEESRKAAALTEADLDESVCLTSNEASTKKELFGFVIPSYKEDIELLAETIMHLADHQDAKKRYMIFLAMEAHEEGSVEKAQLLIQRYSKYFKLMSYSHHHIREHEQKGKASNVSWCVENLEEQEFKKHGINPNDVFLTIIDADSWAPEIYMVELQERLEREADVKYITIYTPGQMFFRNHEEVPLTTRVFDMSHSGIHFINMISSCENSFPLSNYTLSFNLIKRIGFWDTCPDAIGEDFHTMIKSLWKTNGEARIMSIHIPFNQVNVQTGKGYWDDVMARFWQAERHARGCADVAYCLKMLFSRPFHWKTTFMTYHILEISIMPAIMPWAVIGTIISKIISYVTNSPEHAIDSSSFQFLIQFGGNSMMICYCTCYLFFRYAAKVLFKVNVGSIFRVLEFPITFYINLVLMIVPTFVLAAFKVMLNKNEYNTAEKKVKTGGSFIQNVEEQPEQKL